MKTEPLLNPLFWIIAIPFCILPTVMNKYYDLKNKNLDREFQNSITHKEYIADRNGDGFDDLVIKYKIPDSFYMKTDTIDSDVSSGSLYYDFAKSKKYFKSKSEKGD